MTDVIRWGILSTGSIARQFARGLTAQPGAKLVAVGSRSLQKAVAFGKLFHVPHQHGSYEALAHDPEVDIIYVATPHNLHKDNTLLCLTAGKAVLCEKPFAINTIETQEMIQVARQRKLFLMEAMWSRFLPLMVELRALLADEIIGKVRMLTADFGFRAAFNPQSRLFDPTLGGGALLDVGIYAVSLAHMVLGTPSRATGLAYLGETGVDEQAAMILGYEQGQLALLSAAIRTATSQEAHIWGENGRIKIHSPWWRPTTLTLSLEGQEDQVLEMPYRDNGYNYEAAEVMHCLHSGKLESNVMPLDETLNIMRTLDALRAQWGLSYPMEREA